MLNGNSPSSSQGDTTPTASNPPTHHVQRERAEKRKSQRIQARYALRENRPSSTEYSKHSFDKPQCETRPCHWEIYGCPKVLTSQLATMHEAACKFAGNELARQYWMRLKEHESDRRIVSGMWSHFRAVARDFVTPPTYTVDNMDAVASAEGPVVFPASLCWMAMGPPPIPEMEEHTLAKLAIKPPAEKRPENANALTILRQLHHDDHKPKEVQSIMNCSPAGLLAAYPLNIPEWLMKRFTDALGEQTVNVTPTFTLTDIHCDRGLSTVCCQLDKCEKMWLFWPPTPHNNAIFYPAYEECLRLETQCFHKIGALLEGGQVLITGSEQGVFIPSGWIHLVYTLVGGFLVGNSFSAREDLEMFLACVEQELIVANDTKSQETHITFLFTTISRSLLSPNDGVVRAAAGIWIRLVTAMQQAFTNRGLIWSAKVRRDMATIVKDVAKRNCISLMGLCPCGAHKSGGKAFFKHFATHVLVR